MTRSRYDMGDQVRLEATFYSEVELTEAKDPTEITFRVRRPDGRLTTARFGEGVTVTRDGVGQYHVLVDIDQAGHWHYRWEGTGAVKSAEDATFYVPPSPVFGSRR